LRMASNLTVMRVRSTSLQLLGCVRMCCHAVACSGLADLSTRSNGMLGSSSFLERRDTASVKLLTKRGVPPRRVDNRSCTNCAPAGASSCTLGPLCAGGPGCSMRPTQSYAASRCCCRRLIAASVARHDAIMLLRAQPADAWRSRLSPYTFTTRGSSQRPKASSPHVSNAVWRAPLAFGSSERIQRAVALSFVRH
jgi:hypothetical protein